LTGKGVQEQGAASRVCLATKHSGELTTVVHKQTLLHSPRADMHH